MIDENGRMKLTPEVQARVEHAAQTAWKRMSELTADTQPGAPFMPWRMLPEQQKEILRAAVETAIEAWELSR